MRSHINAPPQNQIRVEKVTYVLLRKRVDELGEDLVGDDSFSELIRVIGKTTKS